MKKRSLFVSDPTKMTQANKSFYVTMYCHCFFAFKVSKRYRAVWLCARHLCCLKVVASDTSCCTSATESTIHHGMPGSIKMQTATCLHIQTNMVVECCTHPNSQSRMFAYILPSLLELWPGQPNIIFAMWQSKQVWLFIRAVPCTLS